MFSMNEAAIYLLQQIQRADNASEKTVKIALAIGDTRKDKLTTIGNPYWEKYEMQRIASNFYWDIYWTLSCMEREMLGV